MIIPRSVNKQQFTKIAELSNCNVGSPSSLETFNTADANANMRCLDHGDIIGAITNGQQ